MRYGYYYRTSRSLSPEPLVQLPVSVFRESVKDGSFSQHVDNLISHSRAMSEVGYGSEVRINGSCLDQRVRAQVK